MDTREETRRWMDGQRERDEFWHLAFDEVPHKYVSLCWHDVAILVALADVVGLRAYNMGVPREHAASAVGMARATLPAELSVWLEMAQARFEEHLEHYRGSK